MGQAEIFEWLAKQRLSGTHQYFSVRELTRQMQLEGIRPSKARCSIRKLVDFGFLDVNREWPMRFRAKIKIVNTMRIQNKQYAKPLSRQANSL
jgi:hypothetical protein